jgi:hypothetical protein
MAGTALCLIAESFRESSAFWRQTGFGRWREYPLIGRLKHSPGLGGNFSKTMSFTVFLRPMIGHFGALKNEIFPAALAFLARHFSVFFDDVPFSVARDTHHFPLLALRLIGSNRHSESGSPTGF